MRKLFLLLISSLISFASPLDKINSIRKKSGAGTLKYNKILSIAAKKHAIYLYKNHSFSHYEQKGFSGYYASTPWYRIAKAGYPTKAVSEDISFYENSFDESIKKLMGTVYHRLSLLDLRFDTIGYANYKNIYVYELSNSYLAKVCLKKYKKEQTDYLTDICSSGDKYVSSYDLNRATAIVKRRSKLLVKYPYNNQKNVPLKLIEENPIFLSGNYGYAITAIFNDYYFKKIRLNSFILKDKSGIVDAEIITSVNDANSKIMKGTYILVPLRPLKRATKYNVLLKVTIDGKAKSFKWSFTTQP